MKLLLNIYLKRDANICILIAVLLQAAIGVVKMQNLLLATSVG